MISLSDPFEREAEDSCCDAGAAGGDHRFREVRATGLERLTQVGFGFHGAVGIQQIAEKDVLRAGDVAGPHTLTWLLGFTAKPVARACIEDGMVAQLGSAGHLCHVAHGVALTGDGHMAVADDWGLV